MHMMPHVKVHSLTTYHILLAKFGQLPIELYALKLIMGFQGWLAHLSPLGSSIKQPHSPNTLPNKDLTFDTNRQPCGRYYEVYLIGKPRTTQPHQKQHMVISRRLSLLKNGTLREQTRLPPP